MGGQKFHWGRGPLPPLEPPLINLSFLSSDMSETKSEIEITFTHARHRTEVRATINYLVYTTLHVRSQLLTLSRVDKMLPSCL